MYEWYGAVFNCSSHKELYIDSETLEMIFISIGFCECSVICYGTIPIAGGDGCNINGRDYRRRSSNQLLKVGHDDNNVEFDHFHPRNCSRTCMSTNSGEPSAGIRSRYQV